MNNIRDIQKLNELELEKGLIDKASWHAQFKNSAYIHVGGLPFDLTEGDILALFSQYGEIVDLDLVRDRVTGKSKGFAFIGFEDQRSTVLTVDNLNGIQLLGRTIKVDHTLNYEGRKPGKNEDEIEFAEKERIRKLAILPPHLKPRIAGDDYKSEEEESEASEKEEIGKMDMSVIDKNDPMSAYFHQKRIEKMEKAEKKKKKAKKRDHDRYDRYESKSQKDDKIRDERSNYRSGVRIRDEGSDYRHGNDKRVKGEYFERDQRGRNEREDNKERDRHEMRRS